MNVNSSTSTSNAQTAAKTTASKGTLDMQSFIKLLTVQLSNQNPLEPMNDRDFFAQMAQLGQVQGMEKLQKSADLQQAQSLMGKQITATRDAADTAAGESSTVTGVVKRMTVRSGEYYLGIQEADGGMVDIKMSNLQSVEPKSDVSSASYLIGKKVGGSGYLASDTAQAPIAVVGKVLGVSNENGQLLLQVQTENGIATLPLTNLDQVTE